MIAEIEAPKVEAAKARKTGAIRVVGATAPAGTPAVVRDAMVIPLAIAEAAPPVDTAAAPVGVMAIGLPAVTEETTPAIALPAVTEVATPVSVPRAAATAGAHPEIVRKAATAATQPTKDVPVVTAAADLTDPADTVVVATEAVETVVPVGIPMEAGTAGARARAISVEAVTQTAPPGALKATGRPVVDSAGASAMTVAHRAFGTIGVRGEIPMIAAPAEVSTPVPHAEMAMVEVTGVTVMARIVRPEVTVPLEAGGSVAARAPRAVTVSVPIGPAVTLIVEASAVKVVMAQRIPRVQTPIGVRPDRNRVGIAETDHRVIALIPIALIPIADRDEMATVLPVLASATGDAPVEIGRRATAATEIVPRPESARPTEIARPTVETGRTGVMVTPAATGTSRLTADPALGSPGPHARTAVIEAATTATAKIAAPTTVAHGPSRTGHHRIVPPGIGPVRIDQVRIDARTGRSKAGPARTGRAATVLSTTVLSTTGVAEIGPRAARGTLTAKTAVHHRRATTRARRGHLSVAI